MGGLRRRALRVAGRVGVQAAAAVVGAAGRGVRAEAGVVEVRVLVVLVVVLGEEGRGGGGGGFGAAGTGRGLEGLEAFFHALWGLVSGRGFVSCGEGGLMCIDGKLVRKGCWRDVP